MASVHFGSETDRLQADLERTRAQLSRQLEATRKVDDLRMAEIRDLNAQWRDLRRQVQQDRNAYYEAACWHAELPGHEVEEARASGRVSAYDDVLRMLAEAGTGSEGERATPLDADPSVMCAAYVGDEDGEADECGKPSRFVVARSDGDTSFGINGGSEEACEGHLTDAVVGMIAGNADVNAIVAIRWDAERVDSTRGE